MTVLDFEVRKKMIEALKNGRYIITISVFNPAKKRHDHYAVFNNYPSAEIIPSLSHTTRLIFNQLPEGMVPIEEDNSKE